MQIEQNLFMAAAVESGCCHVKNITRVGSDVKWVEEQFIFSGFIAQSADTYRLEATNNVYIGSGKRCRGYLGIEVLIRPTAL